MIRHWPEIVLACLFILTVGAMGIMVSSIGLAHVSEFQEVYPGKKMNEVLQAGETYSWKILSIEPKDHRMGLVIVKE